MGVYFVYIWMFSALLYIVETKRVNIESGEVFGNNHSISIDQVSYNVYEYLGIPYAQPPTGDLRFRKPEKLRSMESPFKATQYGDICPQLSIGGLTEPNATQSEDCLSINVIVPDRSPDMSSGHAVMVWIHGGGFAEGAAVNYDTRFLAVYGNVILVTFNYRLNVFGFLSTDDDNARGNFGLWDQKMALQWINDTIGYFGGDNERITIVGESAGGISCIIQGLIPDNYGLFQRIIAESGSPTFPGILSHRSGLPDAQTLAKIFGCEIGTSEDVVSCLRYRSWQDILQAVGTSGLDPNRFVPTVDGDLVVNDPKRLIQLSESQHVDEVEFFRSLDIISGFNEYDGAIMLLFSMEPDELETWGRPSPDTKMAYVGGLVRAMQQHDYPEDIIQLIASEYTNWTSPNDEHELRLQLLKLLTDITFGVPALEMAHLHERSTSSSNNYVYLFTPKLSFHVVQTPSWITGANHIDEVLFIIGIEWSLPHLDLSKSWEVQLSRNMITYWTNFAKTGYAFVIFLTFVDFKSQQQRYI